ncbi:hypothetical protein KI387_014325 [Taxus chinensis]|uniref:DC1 domain-containing protein n=1 Tax=Taxus chinensis TaxID=29808 RepID=A0AA38FI29_TAXCH|nr:hypothetical protein KI387_014325 [Taxus chinensis]
MALVQSGIKVGEEIQHFSHPQHALNLIYLPYLYTCSGCKEYGAGRRYMCNQCDFDIHEFCAKAPAAVSHPYHTQHQLIFHKQPGGLKKSKCDVCGKTTNGFAFRCPTCNFCLHPCCSQLPNSLSFKGHPEHSLKLLSGSPDGSPYTCNFCNKKGTTWVYHCAPCDYYLHALCAKPVINGLEEEGIVNVPPKKSKIGRAARYASQVVQLFVDGLVEGLGEGVGDALLNNVTREIPINDNDDKHG